jgi:hypothetical protein
VKAWSKMGLIDNIKRIIYGFNKNKETDFISEEDSTMIRDPPK